MNKLFLSLVILSMLAVSCKKEEATTQPDSNTNTNTNNNNNQQNTKTWLDIFREKSLAEVNFARTNPSQYAEDRLKTAFNASKDNGAYTDLKSRKVLTAIALQDQLNSAALKYSQLMADSNQFGHELYNTTPDSRCKAEGYMFNSGENIGGATYKTQAQYNAETDPNTAAITIIAEMIIDNGVVSLVHRNNILNDGLHKKVGFGWGKNTSTGWAYWVEDFGSK